jgi:predicted nucleic acid-binding protein
MSWMRQADQSNLYVCSITIAELMRGIERQADPIRRSRLHEWYSVDFHRWFATEILDLTETIAERLGRLQAKQEGAGRTIHFPDAAIAATALEFGLTLVTRNTKHFTGLGLTLLDPWQANAQGILQ